MLELDEAAPEHLVLGQADRPLERLVHGVARHDGVAVEDDQQARGRVGDVAEEVALAPELDLAELALGDVEPAEDHVARVPLVVGDRRRQPRDRELRAASVDERALELHRPVLGRRGLESFAQPVPLGRRGEHVPEELVTDRLRVVASARATRGGVEVDDPAVEIDRAEQRRRRVDDRVEKAHLRAQIGMTALVLDPEPGGRGHRPDELRVVGERGVVQKRRDSLAVALDVVRREGAVVADLLAVGRDEPVPVRKPVRDLERRVAKRLRERLLQRPAASELQQDTAGRGAVEPAAQDACEKGDRHHPEGREEEVLERCRGAVVDAVDDGREQQEHDGERARAEHGPEHAAQRGRRLHEPTHDDEEDRAEDDEPEDRPGQGERVRRGLAVGQGDRAPAGVAGGGGRLVDEQDRHAAEERQCIRGNDEETLEPRRQHPPREREEEVRERAEGKAAERETGRPHPVVVRLAERSERPEVADRSEEQAGPVLGPAPGGDEAARDEGHARGERERERRDLVLLVIARQDERRRRGRKRKADGPGEHEGSRLHPSSLDTAFPDSSSFAMKPRAPLSSIRLP